PDGGAGLQDAVSAGRLAWDVCGRRPASLPGYLHSDESGRVSGLVARARIERIGEPPRQGYFDLRGHIYFSSCPDVLLQFVEPRDAGSVSDVPSERSSLYAPDRGLDRHHRQCWGVAGRDLFWDMVGKNRPAEG